MAKSNLPCAMWAVERLCSAPIEEVLEIGYGPGVAVELLSGKYGVNRVCAVDPSEEMNRQASARNRAAINAGRVDLQVGVVEHLPYADGTFDAALSINSLQLWDNQQKGMP